MKHQLFVGFVVLVCWSLLWLIRSTAYLFNQQSLVLHSSSHQQISLLHEGFPFIELPNTLNYTSVFDNATRSRMFHSLGSKQLNKSTCQVPHRQVQYYSFTGFGFGANLLRFANILTFASRSPEFLNLTIVFFPGNPTYPLEKLYANTFQLGAPSTICHQPICQPLLSISSSCQIHKKHGVWTIGWGNFYYQEIRPWLSQYRRQQPSQFLASRMVFVRELLRMRQKNMNVQSKFEKEEFEMGIHLRRTDKFVEAKFVNLEEYVRAVHVASKSFIHQAFRIVIVSDDCGELELLATLLLNWNAHLKIFRRCSVGRPDDSRNRTLTEVDDSFSFLLQDMRLLIKSLFFVGSQSSNLGLVVCLYREGRNCLNVENKENDFIWDFTKDKL